MGPRPVAHIVSTCPGVAGVAFEFTGWLACVTKFWITPGPLPKPLTATIPTAALTTRTGELLLFELLRITWRTSRPRGALDGMMALIWVLDTYTGMAATVVPPWLTLTDTPEKAVCSGNDICWAGVVGPRF